MTLSRRGLLGAFAAAFATPAIVKVESLMKLAPTKVLRPHGISMQLISNYDLADDMVVGRLDVLYGYLHVRPEWQLSIPETIKLDDVSQRVLEDSANHIADAIMYGMGATKSRSYSLQGLLAESIPLSQLVQDARGATSAIE